MSNRYAGFPASFNAGGLVLSQHQSAAHAAGAALEDIVPCGSIDRMAVIMSAGSPSCRLTTHDANTVLGTVSPTVGYNCTGASTFRYRRRDPGGVFATGNVDVVATANLGFLCADAIGARQDGLALMQLNFWPLYDGTNEPVVLTNSNAASGATAAAFNSVYFFGPVYLGSTQLAGCIGSQVSFGKTFQPWRFDGQIFPTTGSIVARRPMFSLTFAKLDHIASTLASLYQAALGSTLKVYYWKGSAGGTRVAAATGAHLQISAAAGAWGGDNIDYQENADGTVTINVRPTGTISISTTSTIP